MSLFVILAFPIGGALGLGLAYSIDKLGQKVGLWE